MIEVSNKSQIDENNKEIESKHAQPTEIQSLKAKLFQSNILKYDGDLSKGILTLKNGCTYTGDMYHNMMHGKGKYTYTNGIIYEGDIYENTLTGNGILTYDSNCIYKGSVLNGLRHGYGEYINKVDKYKYIGQWNNDKRHGKGILYYELGTKEQEDNRLLSYYDGEFQDNKRHGQGILQYKSGTIYNGQWYNDTKHGYGTIKWSNGDIYQGNWFNNQRHGQGEYIYYTTLNTKSINFHIHSRYIGTFKNNVRHTLNDNKPAIFLYSNGSIYYGHFKHNLKHDLNALFIHANGFQQLISFNNDKKVMANHVKKPEKLSSEQPYYFYINDILTHYDYKPMIFKQEKRKIHNLILSYSTLLIDLYHDYVDKQAYLTIKDLWTFLIDYELTTSIYINYQQLHELCIFYHQFHHHLNHPKTILYQYDYQNLYDPSICILLRDFAEILIRLVYYLHQYDVYFAQQCQSLNTFSQILTFFLDQLMEKKKTKKKKKNLKKKFKFFNIISKIYQIINY